jgi:hypothetical protein
MALKGTFAESGSKGPETEGRSRKEVPCSFFKEPKGLKRICLLPESEQTCSVGHAENELALCTSLLYMSRLSCYKFDRGLDMKDIVVATNHAVEENGATFSKYLECRQAPPSLA